MMEYDRLINEAVNGNKAAFEEIYRRTNKKVYFTCLSFLKNEQDAQDTLQDVYLTVLNNLSELKDVSGFEGWLTRITVNKCKDFIKKKKPVAVDDEILTNLIDSNDNEILIPDVYVNDEAKRKIIMEIIRNSLSDILYQTVVLFYFHDMSAADIAKLMDCPVGTVTSRLCIARAKIKKGIEDYEEKNNDKLHSVAMIPMLAAILRAQAQSLEPANVLPNIFSATPDVINSPMITKGGKTMLNTLKGKIIAGAIAATVAVGGTIALTASISNNKQDDDKDTDIGVSTTADSKKITSIKNNDEEDNNTNNSIGKYTSGFGLKYVDDERIAEYQGNIKSIGFGSNVLGITNDNVIFSVPEFNDDVVCTLKINDATVFNNNVKGELAMLMLEDETGCLIWDYSTNLDDPYIAVAQDGFTVPDGAIYSNFLGFAVNDGIALLCEDTNGFYWHIYDTQRPTPIENQRLDAVWSKSLYNSPDIGIITGVYFQESLQIYFTDDNNRLWSMDFFSGTDVEDTCVELDLIPEELDCYEKVFCSYNHFGLVIKKPDDNKLYVAISDYSDFVDTAEVQGITVDEIKEFPPVINEEGLFIGNDGKVYIIDEDDDVYTAVEREDLSKLWASGAIVDIVGTDTNDVFVLMDDGCLYEMSL